MRSIFAFVLAFLLAAVQAAVLRYAGGGAVSLALPLAIVVYLGLRAGNVDGAVGAFGVGYVVDLFTGGPKGLMSCLAVALFLFSRLAGAALSIHGKTGFAILTAFATFLYGAAVLLVTRAVSPAESAPGLALLARVGTEALLTGALSPIVFVAMRWIDGLFAREEPGLLR